MSRTIVIHGKVVVPPGGKKPISPKVQFPDATLICCTTTQQQYEKYHTSLDDWDEWSDLHPVEKTKHYPGIKHLRPRTWKWYTRLPANGRPLWLLEQHPEVPASRAFPIEQVRSAFPIEDEVGQSKPGGMFTCSVDWMIARIILEQQYDHIVLHGHGVSEEPWHMVSHRGILYWIATARAKGIRVTVLKPSWYRASVKAYPLEMGGWAMEKGIRPYRRRA